MVLHLSQILRIKNGVKNLTAHENIAKLTVNSSFYFSHMLKLNNTINIRSDNMNIGILVAVEFDAFYNIYGEPVERYKHGGFEVLKYQIHGKDVFVCPSRAGQIRAAMAMTILLDFYKCETIINYGVVGALSNQEVEELAVVESVCHYEWDTSDADDLPKGQYEIFDDVAMITTGSLVELAMKIDPHLKKVRLASGDKFVAGLEAKTALRNEWGCDIVDMEGAAIAIASKLYEADFVMIKAVSDALTDGGAEFYENFERASKVAVKIIDDLIREI